MATKIDKLKLAQTINDLPELDSETKSQLLQLIHERKQYGLVWEEHHEEVEQQMQTQLPVLVEDKSKFIDSADPQAPNHILIEGDNLPALTTLTYTHKEKIDVIYIDPPYNTGNKDFIYNDHFVGTDDDYRHSKWLSFMSKRLRIAKTLLSDKGVIFISIDDNEQAQLKMLCDEIFGAGNFVYELSVVNNLNGNDNSHGMMETHEYCLIYAHNKELLELGVLPLEEDEENDWFQDEIGYWKVGRCLKATGINAPREARPNLFYPVFINEETLEFTTKEEVGAEWYHLIPLTEGREMSWYWSKETLERDKNEVIVKKTIDGYSLYKKQRPALGDLPSKRGKITFYSPKYANANSNAEIKNIFGKKVFDYAKSTQLIKDFLSLGNAKDGKILDFFAGSGTTLHATMQLNAEDGGHRQCILITNNENHICEEVTYERNKRVIQGYTTPKGEPVAGLTDNKLRYYRTDFVARESSLTAKKQLMLAATDLLCIKESIYTECHTFGNLRLRSSVVRCFADADARMLIIYNPDAIDTIVAEISRMDIISPIRIYVFSANDYAYNADFEAVDNKVSLCALPAAIYNAYRKVLPKKQQPQDEHATTDTELTFEEDTL